MKMGMLVVFCMLVVVGLQYLSYYCDAEKAGTYSFVHSSTSAAAASATLSSYNYIIIGGGTTGCPLAATLSRTHRVLLLERGGSPYTNPNVTQLSNFPGVLFDPSVAQPFISNDTVFNIRARVLGGGSSINAGFYSRAAPHQIAQANWDPVLVNASYQWVEQVVAHIYPAIPWQTAFARALLESGVRPYNGMTYDHLVGTKISGSTFDSDGVRHGAADLLSYADPRRIRVLLHATVRRVVFDRREGRVPVARGVVFVDRDGVEHCAWLDKGFRNEVVVSAGALGSPQILMLSGVGPKEMLRPLGVEVVVDQPMVGQDMVDNPAANVVVPSPVPVGVSVPRAVGITACGNFFEGSSGTNISRQVIPGFDAAKTGVIIEKFEEPLSKGHLELKSLDPNDNPSVIFNYYQDPEDLRKCVEGMKIVKKVIESHSFSGYRFNVSFRQLLNYSATNDVRNLRPRDANTSASLERFCVDTVATLWHYHGGCRVGQVVDGDYRVIGVNGLRVIDGSTLSSASGTNPQATLMMLGRYMGVKIRIERTGKAVNKCGL